MFLTPRSRTQRCQRNSGDLCTSELHREIKTIFENTLASEKVDWWVRIPKKISWLCLFKGTIKQKNVEDENTYHWLKSNIVLHNNSRERRRNSNIFRKLVSKHILKSHYKRIKCTGGYFCWKLLVYFLTRDKNSDLVLGSSLQNDWFIIS